MGEMEREEMNFRFEDKFSKGTVRFYRQNRTTVCLIQMGITAFIGIATRNYRDKDDPFVGYKKAFERALENSGSYFERDERRTAWEAFFAANPRPVEKAA
jgi:hypothetical protein